MIHITLFGGIVFLWGGSYAVRASGNNNWPGKVWYAAAGSCGLGIVLEFVQLYFIPDRSFDGYDIIADTAGAVLAALFLLYVFPKKCMVN